MKFKTLLFTLFALIAQQVTAQVLVGPVVGGNYSWTTFADKDLNDTYNTKPVFGYHAGAQLSFRVKKRFFLHTSLVYSTKGRTLTNDESPAFRLKTQYNFIEMPIVYSIDFKVKTSGSREFKYFLGAGPNLSYWLGGKGAVSDTYLQENHIAQLKYKIAFLSEQATPADNQMAVTEPNRFQLGLNLAAGFVLEPANRQRVMLTVRYELGHTYLAKSNGTLTETFTQDPLRSTNQGFRVSVAYLYDLKTAERNKGRSTVDPKKRK